MTRRTTARCAALAALVFCTAAPGGDAPNTPATLAAVASAHFAEWDADGDGVLSENEVNRLVSRQRIKGDEAAAVAAIHGFQRARREKPKAKPVEITRAYLTRLPKGPGREARRDMPAGWRDIASCYQSNSVRLRSTPRKLFATQAAPTLAGVEQGFLGDCYFMAGVGAVSFSDPNLIRSMIEPHPSGAGWRVTFPNQNPIHVVLTDVQIVLGSSVGEQGVWINVLEQAFGRREKRRDKHRTVGPAIDAISMGGDTEQALETVTGRDCVTLRFVRTHTGGPAGAADRNLANKLRYVLSHSTNQRLLACCSTSCDGYPPPGIPSCHAYAVLGYDSVADVVHVWNPHGNTFIPKGRSGYDNGYVTSDGRFTVTPEDFICVFEEVYLQTTTPAKFK